MRAGEAKRHLHPEVFELYRSGRISLDVVLSVKGLPKDKQVAAVNRVYRGERFDFRGAFDREFPRSCIGVPSRRGFQ
jgi:hypothetical protein